MVVGILDAAVPGGSSACSAPFCLYTCTSHKISWSGSYTYCCCFNYLSSGTDKDRYFTDKDESSRYHDVPKSHVFVVVVQMIIT